MTLTLTSPAFADGAPLPVRFTGRGEKLLPPLKWDGAPPGTAGFALILEDPDAPGGMFRHYGAYGIPPELDMLPEGDGNAPPPMMPVLHDFGAPGLFPPDPPPGTGRHHYRFRLFALTSAPSFEQPPTCQGLIAMMHVLDVIAGEASLTATCDAEG